jgi:uncharacterized protein YlxW (UPF0749 family)
MQDTAARRGTAQTAGGEAWMLSWRVVLTGSRRWRFAVPAVCLLAGLLFATSHEAAQGQELRAPDTANLADLVRTAETQVDGETNTLRRLSATAKAATDAAAQDDSAVAQLKTQATPLLVAAGRQPVAGSGLTVVLDDAASVPDDPTLDQNQLVVHQSDLQAVVNALWAGGAEAVSVAGQRLIATSAVRCVGNTLLLNGRVYSPPYRVEAIGPADAMGQELDRSPGVTLYRQAASYYGLGYTVETEQRLSLPAYDGPLALQYAKAGTR